MGSMSSVSDIAMFCAAVICSSSTARSLTMPNCSMVASQSVLSVIADVARPKTRHASFVGQRRAGHEIDEELRRGLIEPRKPDVLAGLDAEVPQAQRPQPAIRFADAVAGYGPESTQPLEFHVGQRDAPEPGSLGAFVAVIVRAAGDREVAARGDLQVAVEGDGVVVAVVRLDRVEPGRLPLGDPAVGAVVRRVRQRREAAGLVDLRDGLDDRRAETRHERRAARAEEPIERLSRRPHVPRRDERRGDRRPPHCDIALGVGGEDAVDVDGRAKLRQRAPDLTDAYDARVALR